jgi:Fe-S cluster biogenesis protein NfuA
MTAPTDERLAEVLDALNDRLHSHGGEVRVAGYDEASDTLSLRFAGLCGSCPAWPMTLFSTIRPYLRETLGISEVTIEDRQISEAARRRILAAVGG